MSSQPNRPVNHEDDNHNISPFAQTTSSVQVEAGRTRVSLWIVSIIFALLILANSAYFAIKYLGDHYRTLEKFPADKYLADFQQLAGNKFKADFRVLADLGWKENVGRLMVFTVENDSRPILVLIPPKLSGIYFTKGQIYQVALEVGQGGLIYADSCDKE